MTLSTKDITNIIISDILMEAVEDEWGTSIAHRIRNSSYVDVLNEDEEEEMFDNIDAIVFDVKDAIHKLNDFIGAVGCN